MLKITKDFNREPYKTILDVLKEVTTELSFKQLRYILLEDPGFGDKHNPFSLEKEEVERIVNGYLVNMTTREFRDLIWKEFGDQKLPLRNLTDGKPMNYNQLGNVLIDLKDYEKIENKENSYKLIEDQSKKLGKEMPNLQKYPPRMIERYGNVWFISKTLNRNLVLLGEIGNKVNEIQIIKYNIEKDMIEKEMIKKRQKNDNEISKNNKRRQEITLLNTDKSSRTNPNTEFEKIKDLSSELELDSDGLKIIDNEKEYLRKIEMETEEEEMIIVIRLGKPKENILKFEEEMEKIREENRRKN